MITVFAPKKVELIPFLRQEIKRVMKELKAVREDKRDLLEALDLLKEPIKDRHKTVAKVFELLSGLSTSLKDEIDEDLWAVLMDTY